jgi:hypothetical protein
MKWLETGKRCMMGQPWLLLFTRYYCGGKIKENEASRSCSMHVGDENAYKSLVLKHEEKRPVHRWGYNIKIDPVEIVFGSADWIHLAQDRDQC